MLEKFRDAGSMLWLSLNQGERIIVGYVCAAVVLLAIDARTRRRREERQLLMSMLTQVKGGDR